MQHTHTSKTTTVEIENQLNQNGIEQIPLRYGDLISINTSRFPLQFIISDGFIKTKVYVKNLDYDGNRQLFDRCIFRVYPAFNQPYQNLLLKNFQLFNNQISENYKNQEKQSAFLNELQNYILQEYKTNLEIFQKIKGQEVTFNQDIQFLHLASNKFLVCNYEEADIEEQNFKLELQQFSSKFSRFQIKNSFSYQIRNSGIVYYNDVVYIVCSNKYLGRIPYVNCIKSVKKQEIKNQTQITQSQQQDVVQYSLQINQEHQQQQISQSIDFLKKPLNINKENIEIRIKQNNLKNINSKWYINQKNSENQEVSVSVEQKTKWKIFYFSSFIEYDYILQYGDIIWIHHIENASTIEVKKQQNNGQIYIVIQGHVQKELFYKYEGNTNAMWVIQNEEFTKGGPIHWEDNFYLRNISSGKYLSLSCLDKGGRIEGQLQIKDYPCKSSLFQFTQIGFQQTENNQQKYINKDSIFYIKAVQINGWIHINDKLKNFLENERKDDEFQVEINNLRVEIIEQQPLDDDAFRIYKASITEVQETNFLISCFPIIKEQIEILKDLQQIQEKNNNNIEILINEIQENDIQNKLNILKKCLVDINKFCLNQLINTSIENQMLNYGKINQNRQKLLAEQYYIILISDLLQSILNEKELLQIQNLFKYEKKNKFIQKIKNCLKKQKDYIIDIKKLENTLATKAKYCEYTGDNLEGNFNIFNILLYQKNNQKKVYQTFLREKYQVAQACYKLMTNICKNNSENEKYFYNYKINQLKYQAKYIKEAMYCIISVIKKNEFILNNMADDINVAQRKVCSREFSSHLNILNQSEEIQSKNSQQNTYMQLEGNNILVFLINLVEKNQNQLPRNPLFIQFFRTICKYKDNGISANQEVIYKFIENSPLFKKALFLPIYINEKDKYMYLQIQDKNNNKCQIIKIDEKMFGKDVNFKYDFTSLYFIEQLKLCSDLCLSRNFLWNSFFEKQFPLDYLIEQVFNQNMHDELRSAFCSLILTIYIDHEPLNEIIMPQMCRIYDIQEDKKTIVQNNIEKTELLLKKRQPFYELIIKKANEYVDQQIQRIDEKFERIQNLDLQLVSNFQDENIFNQSLILHIIKLMVFLIKFNVLGLLNKREMYAVLIPKIIRLLEYNNDNLELSCFLKQQRSVFLEKKKSFIFRGSSFVYKRVSELFQQGFFEKKEKKGNFFIEENVESVEYEHNYVYKNPLIGSLISLLQIIKIGKSNEQQVNQYSKKTESLCKLELIKILQFVQNLYMDYLIANFIAWFGQMSKQIKKNNQIFKEQIKNLLVQNIQEDLSTALPDIMKTGLQRIDEKYIPWEQSKEKKLSFFSKNNKSNQQFLYKKKKFQDYTEDDNVKIKDLNCLLTGVWAENGQNCSFILGSLLTGFYLSTDSQLQDSFLEIIVSLYSQNCCLFKNLQKLEVLYDEADIKIYQVYKNRIFSLRTLAEKSEIWLSTLHKQLKNSQKQTEIQEIQEILSLLYEINSLFFENSKINNQNQIKHSPFYKDYARNPYLNKLKDQIYQKIDLKRQKMFTFLEGHLTVINLIKNAQNQMVQYLKQNDVLQNQKIQIFSLLKGLYQTLIHFSINSVDNQILLSKFIPFFIG
ncbi:MIR domain protein [Ichthyophthirius multifiliis]|uniref:MIR domain protein n=1 Tax=Ichthyophthirius multifiliis TaxID=5932 RepID=G0R4L7_ICHMU|nr:MIR domain protein [Ichthyophthirius multifiliis]EGR27577.1 MIR domain protein [Ichthyophthirius multifiliis]|eukprot:XP_004025029.1 MIR domain protein [Ichthyophthirius multifiliis]